MIAHLRGTVHKLETGEVTVDVQGVGYRAAVPLDVWGTLDEGQPAMLWISTYVREDRFELYGFADRAGRTLFEEFLNLPGIGPRMALELCAVPRGFLLEAATSRNSQALTSIKGVGKKTAEKLLLELRSLLEKKPDLLGTGSDDTRRHEFDQDAIATLSTLGYDSATILATLRGLPPDLKTTEDRVAAALRSL
ncbi:Holliday junction branch migration protein RuvA [Candidatus Peregrinibacteria bacterium]|nr:Holliday junction branch migration protein RuvA [Candidatus Peregrinibacteria bacterium]MBI3816283.1 Holliday junction branch migration protein RuvA [Candidatus Peregrinibacteria bacterium]